MQRRPGALSPSLNKTLSDEFGLLGGGSQVNMISSGNKIIDLYRRHQREISNHLSRGAIVSNSNQNSTDGGAIDMFSRSRSNEEMFLDFIAQRHLPPIGQFSTEDSKEHTQDKVAAGGFSNGGGGQTDTTLMCPNETKQKQEFMQTPVILRTNGGEEWAAGSKRETRRWLSPQAQSYQRPLGRDFMASI